MSYDNPSDNAFLQSLTEEEAEALHLIVSAPMEQISPASRGFDLATACKYYDLVKGYLPYVKTLVAKIPSVGSKISMLLEALDFIAMTACPITGQHQLDTAGGQITQAAVPDRLSTVDALLRSTSDSTYKNAKITNGYGSLAKAGLSITRGATATIVVDLYLTSVSESDFSSWMSDQSSTLTTAESSKLKNTYAAGGGMAGALLGAFGAVFGGGAFSHYKNSKNETVKATDKKQEGFLKSVHNLKTQQVHVQGKITATGQSYIPTVAEIYAQTSTIKFSDGTEISVIDSNGAVVADSRGNTSDVSGSGSLSIVKAPTQNHP